ncbi:glycoside hydrolase family protein [Asticcacaulis biprosthecium]|nr:glycoside hydrolase family protein [Asticcacaulis biprosthecium]
MRARQKVSRAGVELIKSFEGLRSTAARLPDGRWTLGYGHTFSARDGARVTQEDADALLRFDLLPIVDALNNLILVPLNQNQFDALVSFCFNIGVDNFGQSTVLKRINEGRMTEAALAMDAWRSAEFNGQTYVLAPLIRRRAAEKNLFLTPDEASGNAPTLLVRPVEDAGGVPLHQPSELNSPDRGGILSAFPVGVQQTAEPSVTPPSALPPEMLSPYARPAPATFGQPVAQPVVQPVAQPLAQPLERVVEALPEGLLASSALRETPMVEEAPLAHSPYAGEDPEPQMSPAVAAAIARAQEEQRLRDEAQQDIQRQAAALAAARAAEEARIAEQQRLEAARQEQERLDAERLERERAAITAEANKLEQERLERERLERERLAAAEAMRQEQARLELEHLDRERFAAEAARREQDRVEYERAAAAAAEAARLEQERQARERAVAEAARLEQETREREARDREAREREARDREAREREGREREAREREARELAEREKAAVQPASQPSDEEAEKIRKAEAAAALMRLYSPYGGGALGRPLAAPRLTPTPTLAPTSVPVQPAPAPEEFTNQSVIAPQSASSSPIELSSRPQPVAAPQAPAPEEADDEPEMMGFTPFKPVVSPSAMPAPVITALNPYAKPVAKAEPARVEPVKPELVKAQPEVVEVPRPRAVDLSAAPAAEAFTRPEPAQPAHWREQLQRPLPAGYAAHETAQPETQTSLLNANPAFDDDNSPWTIDGDRIALSADETHEEGVGLGKMILRTMKWIFVSGLGLLSLGVAAASWFKFQDPTAVRNGMAGDFKTLSIVAAAVGIFFVSVSVWLIMKRLGGLKD